jgi:aspartyl-tRNA(Asn)/glutamyl-tRNA(Gln) amidotransferase subunit C
MEITEELLRHLAQLSELDLSDAEIKARVGDLREIIKYIEQLGELDTQGVEPTYQVTGRANVMREDVVAPQIPREKLLALAPDMKNNQVKVPKVL